MKYQITVGIYQPGIVHAKYPNALSANVTATALDPITSSGDRIV